MKTRFKKLLLHALIVCSLAAPSGLGEGEIPAGTAAPTLVPATEAPATQAPATEAPATEIPATEASATQAPATEAPTSEPAVTDAPSAEPPTSEPTATAPATDAPATQVPETLTPSTSPSAEPSGVPSASPSAEATIAPSLEPTAEPSPEPSAGPTSESTPQPSLDPSIEPSASPSVSPSPTPSATPLPLPDATDGLVTITPEGGTQQEGGAWSIVLSAPESPLVFTWTVSGEAQSHLIYVQDALGALSFITETGETRIELDSAAYATGQHTLYVGAVLADGSVTWGSAIFELASQQGSRPGGMGGFGGFGGMGGARPSGSGSMGASGMPQEEQGFRVTPGEALTGKHAAGTMDTTAYTHSDIETTKEARSALVLDSTQAQITLDGGASTFFAEVQDGRLQLTPEAGGEAWQLSALAMNTLASSGIDRVVFHLDSTSWSLPTRMQFSGSVYSSLRAQGYVTKDIAISIGRRGVQVRIAGGVYAINEGGELVPFEG